MPVEKNRNAESPAAMQEAMLRFLGRDKEAANEAVGRSDFRAGIRVGVAEDEVGKQARRDLAALKVYEADRVMYRTKRTPGHDLAPSVMIRAEQLEAQFNSGTITSSEWYEQARALVNSDADLEALGRYYNVHLGPRIQGYMKRSFNMEFAGGQGRRANTAEDISQSTARRIFSGLQDRAIDLRDEQSFAALAFRTARNRAIDLLRNRPSNPIFSLDDKLVQKFGYRAEGPDVLAAKAARQAMDRLTPNQQAVVKLKVFGELSNAEVAEILRTTEGAVKSRYHRAIRTLGHHLGHLSQ